MWTILRTAGIASPTHATVSWTALLRSQAAAACDFVTVDTALERRFYLLFFIDVVPRRVTLAGITTNPTGTWTSPAARNLFITTAHTFEGCKILVWDRAGQFTDTFDEIFRTEGIKIAKTPPRTPVANFYIERWFGTLRREMLDRTIIWNEKRLRRLVVDYVDHYNRHRPHRSLCQTTRPADAHPVRTRRDRDRPQGLRRPHQRVPTSRLNHYDRVFGTHRLSEQR